MNFILFFGLLMEAVILWQYSSNLFVPIRSNKRKFFLISVFYTLLFFLSLLQAFQLNLIAYFIANILFLILQFKVKLSTALFHSTVLTTIMGFSELITFGIVSHFFPKVLSPSSIGVVLHAVFSKFLFFMIAYYVSYLFKGTKTKQASSSFTDIFLLLIPALTIFIMSTFLEMGEVSPLVSPLNTMISISALCLVIINILILGIRQYAQKRNQEFTEMQLLLLKESNNAEYYEMLRTQTEDKNILIHDIKKHLQSIELLNEKNDSEGIRSYIHSLMDSPELKGFSRICDNEILNAILYRYQHQCIEKQISFHVDIRSGAVQQLSWQDLTSLFCNLLDNALEAAETVSNSFIDLSVQKKEGTPYVLVVLINSCREKPTYDAAGSLVSQKTNKFSHGFGIKSIKKVVQKYHGEMQMYYDEHTKTFHTILTLLPDSSI